jgi:hypothetical protein
MKSLFSVLLTMFISISASAQKIAAKEIDVNNLDTVINEMVKVYKHTGFSLQKIIKPTIKDSIISIDCYSGADVEIIAIFNTKPISLKGIFSVYQITKTKTYRENFSFQEVVYQEGFKKYCSLIEVRMSPMANKQNCYAKIFFHDQKLIAVPIALIVLTN